MGERTEYAPGTFSWADITTTDQEAAKAFYTGLFGWDAEDVPVGDGVTYTMLSRDGKTVGAISPQQEQQRALGLPPVWNSYVTVASADDAAARAAELGATVHAPPFDVMDVGRMAVVQDPQRAFFMLWEPRASIGAEIVNTAGSLCWNELVSPDLDGSTAFYRGLFGWDIGPMPDSPLPYFWVKNGEANAAGMREPQPGEPPYWLVYFGSDGLEASLATVEELGGTSLSGPIEMGPVRIAMVRDPQGGTFALYQGELEP
jgi:predicted enzyme related to lactoylglutathione lyase